MRYVRNRAAAAAIVGAVVLAGAVGIAIEAAKERSDIRVHAAAITSGDPSRGEAMFIQYGCGSCHGLKHVRKANGAVGPPLDGIAARAIIAGKLDNNPTSLQAWIRDPQHISPGTAMPDLNVSQGDARDITAFLHTRAE